MAPEGQPRVTGKIVIEYSADNGGVRTYAEGTIPPDMLVLELEITKNKVVAAAMMQRMQAEQQRVQVAKAMPKTPFGH
jgi:uncharacterized protein YggE